MEVSASWIWGNFALRIPPSYEISPRRRCSEVKYVERIGARELSGIETRGRDSRSGDNETERRPPRDDTRLSRSTFVGASHRAEH